MEIQIIVVLVFLGLAQATPRDICDQTFEALHGQTRTIRFLDEDGYSSNMNCVFHLRGSPSEHIRITFLEFDVEKHRKCGFDYLQIFDGPDTSRGRSIGKLCGYTIPEAIETTGSIATMKFVSDRTYSRSGFILQFTSKAEQRFTGQCEPTFTKSTGSFQSPLYPQNYPNRVNCTYQISPTAGNQILITFHDFQIESSSKCIMDYVTIKTRSGEQIAQKLCGDLSGHSYIVPGSHAIINFVSDKSSTRPGFEIRYRVIASCDDVSDVCPYGCTVQDGTPRCTCRVGYSAPPGEAQCYDVNECKANNGDCDDHCINTIGSYKCECTLPGLILAPDGRNCTDRTCAVNNAGCEQNCHLIGGGGGYHCTCNSGFTIAYDQHNCTDIDECTDQRYPHSCEQTCVNEQGSYYCDCGDGYTLSSNRRTCDDINECTVEGTQCEQSCSNFPGGWACGCYEGYEVNPNDQNGCIDTNECAEGRIPDQCSDCVNYEGGFTCTSCYPGYALSDDETSCSDLNECDQNNGGCHQECVNTPGSYNCGCYSGQSLIPGKEDKGECADINECAPNRGKGPCEHYCENSVGSFRCHCLPGYLISAVNGIECRDINECLENNGGCQQQCTNRIGSFTCSCFDGYRSEDNEPCKDINECIEEKPCDADLGAICHNLNGSFSCQCPPGYVTVNQTICQDVDECAVGPYGPTHGCAQQCVNTAGSFKCTCFNGYVKVNNSCADINECSLSKCEHNELCRNTEGSFQCGCREGHFLAPDGISCLDVDECDEQNGGSTCTQICINEKGGYSCDCRHGYELDADNVTCNDINECTRNISGCSDGCVNVLGSFRCFCYQGFQLVEGSNKTCEDTDECATNNGGCHHVCDNSIGSFRCSCRDGYQAGSDERCHDINECQSNNGGCDKYCHNFNGTYNCTCDPNFKLGEDEHSCSHCPDCATFEKLQADVANLRSLHLVEADMRDSYEFLAARVARMEDDLRRVLRQLGI